MSIKNSRIRTVRTRTNIGRKFKLTKVEEKKSPVGYRSLFELPGFNPGLPAKKVRVLFDEDAGSLNGRLIDLGLNALSVAASTLASKSDAEIAKVAHKEKRILITFNHNDFFFDNRGISINHVGCPGIIAIKGGNNAPGGTGAAAQMVEQILIQIGQCVPSAWWPQTKLSVTGERISFKKLLDGEMHEFIMQTDNRGVLWTKKVRRNT